MNFRNEYELQSDLAKYLREAGYLTYTEIEIKGGRGGRADVVALKPSYANKDCRIYEVKNNRGTFNNDTKYEKYFDVCHRLYIACPKGMISKDELPDKIGLIVRGENGWQVVKAAKRNEPKDFNIDFVLSLLYRGYEETKQIRNLRDRVVLEENVKLSRRVKSIGWEIARRLDRTRESQVEKWVIECARIFKENLGVDISTFYDEKGLPDLWEVEKLLKSISGYTKDIKYIREIGEYLRNLDLPEEEKYSHNTRKNLREQAMRFKESM